MLIIHVAKVEMNTNSAGEPGYPRWPVRLEGTLEESCENRLTYINKKDIVSCYPCRMFANDTKGTEVKGWKILVRGESVPIYCFENDLDNIFKLDINRQLQSKGVGE